MPSLLTATKFPFSNSYIKLTILQYKTCGPLVLSCMKTLHAYTPHRCTHPVTILYQSTEYGNSNTPLGLSPGGTHTTKHAMKYRVMTMTTKMTIKLLYATALAPKGIISRSGYCLFAVVHRPSGKARAFVHEL
jgi:hypothetical protein